MAKSLKSRITKSWNTPLKLFLKVENILAGITAKHGKQSANAHESPAYLGWESRKYWTTCAKDYRQTR